MKIALIQFNATADKNDNLRRAFQKVEEAASQGSRFVLLPEVFAWRGDTRNVKLLGEIAEPLSGEIVSAMLKLAAKHKLYILLGSIFERSMRSRKVYNTSVLLSPQGSVVGKYRKINLFDARIGDKVIRESDCIIPGRGGRVFKVDEFNTGLSICYDLRFPGLYKGYGDKKVSIITVPSCFTRKTGQAHWEVLLRARAIETLSYVLAPNQVGVDFKGVQAYGNSMIVAPWGEVIARGSDDNEEIVYGEIETTKITEARKILPGVIK